MLDLNYFISWIIAFNRHINWHLLLATGAKKEKRQTTDAGQKIITVSHQALVIFPN